MLGKLLFRLRCRRRRLAIVRLFTVMGPPVDDKIFIPTVAYAAAWSALADLEKALYGDQIAYPVCKGQG